MEVGWDKLGAEGFEDFLEGVGMFGTRYVPFLSGIIGIGAYRQQKQGSVRESAFVLEHVSLQLFSLHSLRAKEHVSFGLELSESITRTLSCSPTASTTHLTLASRARTSTAA